MASIIHRTGGTFIADPPIANGVTGIDGYMFIGMPYYDVTGGVSAVGTWLKLREDPGYASLPPIESISATTTVIGTVSDN